MFGRLTHAAKYSHTHFQMWNDASTRKQRRSSIDARTKATTIWPSPLLWCIAHIQVAHIFCEVHDGDREWHRILRTHPHCISSCRIVWLVLQLLLHTKSPPNICYFGYERFSCEYFIFCCIQPSHCYLGGCKGFFLDGRRSGRIRSCAKLKPPPRRRYPVEIPCDISNFLFRVLRFLFSKSKEATELQRSREWI